MKYIPNSMNVRSPISKQKFIDGLLRVSYGTLIFILLSVIISFALAYVGLSYVNEMHTITHLGNGSFMERFLNSLYFSVITTTTVGYGDMIPQGFSKVFASVQSLMGFSVAAFFVTKLLSYRQELALHNIHKLSFESTFYRMREELFIVRKDYDAMIKELNKTSTLSEHAWANFEIACSESRTILNQIPSFYDSVHRFYTIDELREELLLEAVQRTFDRLLTVVKLMNTLKVLGNAPADVEARLKELISVAAGITSTWGGLSPHKHEEDFERLDTLVKALREWSQG